MATRKRKMHRNILPFILVGIGLIVGASYLIGTFALRAQKEQLVQQVKERTVQKMIPQLKSAPTPILQDAEMISIQDRIKTVNAQLNDFTELIKPSASLITIIGGVVMLMRNLFKSKKEKETTEPEVQSAKKRSTRKSKTPTVSSQN